MSPKLIIKRLSLLLILGLSAWLLKPPPEPERARPDDADPDAKPVEVLYEIRFTPQTYYPGLAPMGVGEPLRGMSDVIADFEALYPDTRIIPVKIPTNREFLVTQLSGGLAPEILSRNVEDIWGDLHKNWFVPLDAWLDAPNPFVEPGAPGAQAWWDLFKYQAISRGKAAPNGKYYCISYDMIETAIYYNKTIFDELGLSPPETWEDFEYILETIREAKSTPQKDYPPIQLVLDVFFDWGMDLTFDQIYRELLPGIDLAQDPRREEYLEGYLDWFEICFLHDKGYFTRHDPRFVEVMRQLKRFRGYTSQTIDMVDFIRSFIRQETAMIWGMCMFSYRFATDRAIDFEWDVFYLPPFTPQTSRFVREIDPMCAIGGSGMQYLVTNSAVSDTDPELPFEQRIAQSRRLERVMAFLQFITAPENYERIVNERPLLLPNIRGVPALPLLRPYEKILERRYTTTKWSASFDLKFLETVRRTMGLYLDGYMSEEEFLEWFEDSLDAACTLFERRQPPDYDALEAEYRRLAPRRAGLEGLPQPPNE